MPQAITRDIPQSLPQCQLTHIDREPIDVDRAAWQHRQYLDWLGAAGVDVTMLPAEASMPDSAFVEDCAVVLDQLALVPQMGAAARRPETAAIEKELAKYRPIRRLDANCTLDGGDVLTIGRSVYVGISKRTTETAAHHIQDLLGPMGYTVTIVRVTGCLHLKTGCARLDDETVICNPDWIDSEQFTKREVLHVPASEPFGAGILSLGNAVLVPAEFPATAQLISERGFSVDRVNFSEFLKAEAGPSCLSIIFDA